MSHDTRLAEVTVVTGPSLTGTGKGIIREAGGDPESVFRRCKTAHWCPLKRPARRRQRRWVRAGKSIRRHRRGLEEFLEPAHDLVGPRSPGRLTRPQRHGVSVGSGLENALATVAALPSAAVLCEQGLPATRRVSRAWGLVWKLAESSRVSASVAVTTWPRRSAARAGGQRAARTGVRGGLRRGLAIVLAVAALASWFWQPGTSAVAPSGDTVRTVAGTVAADSVARQSAGSERVTGPSGQAYHARAIETIRTGQRVLAHNPQLAEAELPDAPVDPASWVNIHLRMAQATGDPLEITLLRPVEWLAAQLAETAALDAEYPQALEEARSAGAALEMTNIRSVIRADEVALPAPGGIPALGADQAPTTPWIFLTLHELAAVGPAEVVRVEPCPPIEPGAGRLVTGTFFHHSGEILDITVDGLTEPIGCTGAHPFWSEDRQDFIPARNLVPGETLRTESGTLRQITRITPRRGPPVPVFNLEVDAEHVYFVSVDGVLVHNAYGDSRGPVESRHFSSSVQGRELHEIAQSYREAAQLGPYRNVATADVTVNGVRKSVRFKNDPSGMHSEQRLIAWHKLMTERGRKIELHGIYSERPPCGPGSADCRDTLGNYFGQFLDVWHGNR